MRAFLSHAATELCIDVVEDPAHRVGSGYESRDGAPRLSFHAIAPFDQTSPSYIHTIVVDCDLVVGSQEGITAFDWDGFSEKIIALSTFNELVFVFPTGSDAATFVIEHQDFLQGLRRQQVAVHCLAAQQSHVGAVYQRYQEIDIVQLEATGRFAEKCNVQSYAASDERVIARSVCHKTILSSRLYPFCIR